MIKIFQKIFWDLAISDKFNDADKITTGKADENNSVISGKNPSIPNVAIKPTFTFATTQPGATGINETTAAEVDTNSRGASQKIGLSAPEGTIISLAISFKPSPTN